MDLRLTEEAVDLILEALEEMLSGKKADGAYFHQRGWSTKDTEYDIGAIEAVTAYLDEERAKL